MNMKTTIFRKHRVLRMVCALGAILMLGSSLVACGSKITEPENSFMLMYSYDDEEFSVLKNGKSIGAPLDVDEDGDVELVSGLDGTAAYILTDDGVLYAVTGKKVREIADDATDAVISTNGATIVYWTDRGELYFYNVKKDMSFEVCDNYEGYGVSLSPNGKTLAYADDNSTTYIYKNGRSEKFERNARPVAISDKASTVYYWDTEKEAFYAKNRKTTIKLGEAGSDLYFNVDHTEAAALDDGALYIVTDGKTKEKVATSVDIFCEHLRTYNEVTCAIDSFVGQYLIKEDGTLLYIEKGFSTKKIATDVYNFTMSRNGKVCYYVVEDEDGDEYLYRSGKLGEEGVEILDEPFETLYVTSDGAGCYYVDEEDALHYIEGNGTAKEIAEEVQFAVLTHDDFLMFIHDADLTDMMGTLSYSNKGGEAREIADEVFPVLFADEHTVYYFTDLDYSDEMSATLYMATKKVKFSKLGEEIMIKPGA